MAKLDLDESERTLLSSYADRLIDSFNILDTIDSGDSLPMYTVLDVQNVLREDVSLKMLSRDELLKNAPMQEDGYFQVPKTL